MTQEEKAKAYDETLEKATALYKAAEPMSGCNVIIEILFPELKESEDEKIRKELITHCRNTRCVTEEEPVRKTSADIESAMQEVEEKSKAFTKAHKKESSDEILAQMLCEEYIRYDHMKFEPFQKVLIRLEDGDSWEADLFGTYKPLCDNHYHCVGGWWPQCIPYEGNENLLGTHDNCDKYYVTWDK